MIPRSSRREQWLLVVILVAGSTWGATYGWLTRQDVAFLVCLLGGGVAIRRVVTLLADPTDEELGAARDPYRATPTLRPDRDGLERLFLGALLSFVGILGIVCAAKTLWSLEVAIEAPLVAIGVRWIETAIQDARHGA